MTDFDTKQPAVHRITMADLFATHGSLASEIRSALRYIQKNTLKFVLIVIGLIVYVTVAVYFSQFNQFIPALFVAIAEAVVALAIITLSVRRAVKKLMEAGKPKNRPVSGARRH